MSGSPEWRFEVSHTIPTIVAKLPRNHAIDEFLVDLVKAEPKLGNRPDMIRIGGLVQ